MTTNHNLQAAKSPTHLVVSAVNKPIAIRLGQQELDEVLQLARAEDRPAGNFARMVYLLGLAVYREQGFLTLQVDVAQPARSRWQAASGLVNEKPIAMRLPPAEQADVEEMARNESRRPGNFARAVFRMGMPIYRQRIQQRAVATPAGGAVSYE